MLPFGSPHSARAPRPFPSFRGFTLQEVLIALSIAAILAATSTGLWHVQQRYVVSAAANALVAQLALARSEAIKRDARVTICPTRDRKRCLKPHGKYTPWQQGWLIYSDANRDAKPQPDEIVRVRAGVADGIVIRSSRARRRVTYQSIGTAAGSTITFAICDKHNPALARYVIVSNGGRARVARTTTSKIKCG